MQASAATSAQALKHLLAVGKRNVIRDRIASADDALSAAGIPTYTELVMALQDHKALHEGLKLMRKKPATLRTAQEQRELRVAESDKRDARYRLDDLIANLPQL